MIQPTEQRIWTKRNQVSIFFIVLLHALLDFLAFIMHTVCKYLFWPKIIKHFFLSCWQAERSGFSVSKILKKKKLIFFLLLQFFFQHVHISIFSVKKAKKKLYFKLEILPLLFLMFYLLLRWENNCFTDSNCNKNWNKINF